MIDLLNIAKDLQSLFEERGWDFCFIGGLELFASCAIDIRDAEGISVRREKTLDWRYVEEQLCPLAELKEEPEIMQKFARLRKLGSTL